MRNYERALVEKLVGRYGRKAVLNEMNHFYDAPDGTDLGKAEYTTKDYDDWYDAVQITVPGKDGDKLVGVAVFTPYYGDNAKKGSEAFLLFVYKDAGYEMYYGICGNHARNRSILNVDYLMGKTFGVVRLFDAEKINQNVLKSVGYKMGTLCDNLCDVINGIVDGGEPEELAKPYFDFIDEKYVRKVKKERRAWWDYDPQGIYADDFFDY